MARWISKKPIPETTEGMREIHPLHFEPAGFTMWQNSDGYFLADKEGKIIFGPELAHDYTVMKLKQITREENENQKSKSVKVL